MQNSSSPLYSFLFQCHHYCMSLSSINLLGKNWWCHISFVSAYHVNLLCHSLCIKVKSYVLFTLYMYFRMLEIMILTRMSLRQSHILRRCFVPNCGIWRFHCFVANGYQYFYAYTHTDTLISITVTSYIYICIYIIYNYRASRRLFESLFKLTTNEMSKLRITGPMWPYWPCMRWIIQ